MPAYDVSSFGFVANLIASSTFPSGFILSAWADDADPFDIPSIVIADTGMGINGDMLRWSKASPIPIKVAVIEGSDDDENLTILLDANTAAQGQASAADDITVSVVYPNGKTLTLSNGVMVGGMPAPSVSTNGRLKTKTYDFHFADRRWTTG